MNVTKQMLHQDLQHTYGFLAFLPSVLRLRWVVKLLNALGRIFRREVHPEGLLREERTIPSSDGAHRVRLLIYRPEEADAVLPVVIYIHGGGYIMGSPEQAVEIIEQFIRTRPCVVIAPDYRKAFTEPFPAGFDDCYQTLLWAKAHASELNILPERFVVVGHSAGGGLTAAVTLKARDTQEVDIAFQMPIYPMIDDTQPMDPAREIRAPVWDTRMNTLGWDAYLAGLRAEGGEITAYAAPARNTDYKGFPPTITFVGTLEPFYWETASYVESLRRDKVEVAYEEYEGCFHAFDALGGKAPVSKAARDFTYRHFGEFYDKYVVHSTV